MQAPQPEKNPDDAEFDALFAGTVFVPDSGSVLETNSGHDFKLPAISGMSGANAESSPETDIKPAESKHLLLPSAASIVVHICLLFLLRQLIVGTETVTTDIELRPPSIQISFRPRPAPPPEPQTVEQEEPSVTEPTLNEALTPAIEMPTTQAIAEQTTEETSAEPPSAAPRLVAPALLDVRDLIQNHAQNDEIRRIYNNINCDQRQRRADLIDCGDEDPNNKYDFAAAEQNATAEFFAGLNLPIEDTSTQSADPTGGAARTRAAQQNMTGNLGANPLIRSVMGQP